MALRHQHWRFLVAIVVTLVVYHCLCTQVVDAKRISKQRKTFKSNHALNAGKTQQRRQNIVKCCGKDSCSNIAPRSKNNISKRRRIESTTEEIILGTEQLRTHLAPDTSKIPSVTLNETVEMTEMITDPPISTTLEDETDETTTKLDVTTLPVAEISSSTTKTITTTTSSTTPSISSQSFSATSTSSIHSSSDATSLSTATPAITSTSTTSTTTTSTTTTSTTTKTSTTTRTSTSTTTTTTTTTRPLLPGVFIYASKYGSWREVCGELYLFGKSIVNWTVNAHRCCSIGMLPISFDTTNKFDCIFNIAKTEKWPYNMNYWTSGRRIHSNNTFEWCLANKTSYLSSSGSMWATQQPDNRNGSENCVHFNIPKNQNRTQLTDRDCTDTYVFACKGSTTPAPKCHTPVCPTSTCEKDETFYTVASDGVTKFLKDPKLHGTWITINNRIYVFSTSTATWQEGAKACCSIGTKILSVDNDYEYGMLSGALAQSKGAVTPGQFWTSATDADCEGAFGWCAVTKLVRGALWANGIPDVGKRCVTVNVDLTNTTLKTSDCSAKMKYICETRDTGTATTGGRAMKDECASVYNVSDAEQDSVFNSTTYSRKVKCFLKCLGENGGFILNGKLVDESLIKMAEALSPTNIEQLQKDLSAVESCSSIKGMDECDTVALTFQCGQEKAPALVANAITAVELAPSEVEKSPLQPTIGTCIMDFSCVMDPTKQQAFAASSAVSDGFIEVICGKKYFFSNTEYNYRGAASKCCEYGLNLLSLDAPGELQCVTDASLGAKARPLKIWTSASRKGAAADAFRWCSSKASFNYSQFVWSSVSINYAQHFVATIYLQPTFAATYFNVDPDTGINGHVLCEEQPL